METTSSVIPFFYRGNIAASKSLMNRALIVKSFFPELILQGDSESEDVVFMKKAISILTENISKNRNNDEIIINCGEAGTTFRFMAFRVSREKEKFILTGKSRLFERPHDELIQILSQLGVHSILSDKELKIQSSGWKSCSRVMLHRSKSSQFASGFLLSCWNLPFEVEIMLEPPSMKDSYWDMTLKMVRELGMNVNPSEGKGQYKIPAHQKINVQSFTVEPDMSSVFSIAVMAALMGDIHIMNFPQKSLQPDFKFLEILNLMKIYTKREKNELTVSCTDRFFAVNINMQETPDLFPVLSILCAFAQGTSRLYGAPRLAFKESNRIKKTSELLTKMKVQNVPTEDGIIIHGQGRNIQPQEFVFDPDHDHRMAMAAGLLKRMGWKIDILNPEVVAKSFPDFWEILGAAR